MSANPGMQTANPVAGPDWKWLYRVGGVAALLVVVLWSVEIVGVAVMGTPPSTVAGWFALVKDHGSLALLDTYLLDAIAVVCQVPLFLALYVALKRASDSLMAIAAALMLIGLTLYLASNVSLPMYSLGSQYAAATSDAQRTQIAATGQAILEFYLHGTGITTAFILLSAAGLIISIVMLRGGAFGKVAAVAGIVANAVQLVEPPAVFAPAGFYDGIGAGFLMIMISFVFFVIWFILIALALFRLGRHVAE